MSDFAVDNKTLAPTFEVDQVFFDEQIRKYVHKFNYTLNPGGVFDAIKYQYTFWPDPTNRTMIREEYINVRSKPNSISIIKKNLGL